MMCYYYSMGTKFVVVDRHRRRWRPVWFIVLFLNVMCVFHDFVRLSATPSPFFLSLLSLARCERVSATRSYTHLITIWAANRYFVRQWHIKSFFSALWWYRHIGLYGPRVCIYMYVYNCPVWALFMIWHFPWTQ